MGRVSKHVYRFTEKFVKEVKPAEKRLRLHDAVINDLVLQITPSGAKTFYLYKMIDGEPVHYKLGKADELTVKQVREKALKVKGVIASGVNPQKVRRNIREEDTMDDMYKKYMVEKKGQISNTTYMEYQRMWRKDLRPVFGKKRISQVGVDSLKRFHKKFDYKPYYANRCINFIQGMFNFFIKEGVFKGNNPAKGVKLNKEEHRIRYLEHSELERFFKVLNEIEGSVSRNAILVMLLTGARKSNVLCMRWDELDLDAKIWRMTKTKTGMNKTIPLADTVVELLSNIKANNPDPKFVFPSETSASGHIVEVKRVWNTIKKKANLTNLHLHDLRHTLATYMIATGASPFAVQRALTHSSIKSTEVYVNLGVELVRDSVNSTVNTLQRIGKMSKLNDDSVGTVLLK